MPTEMEKVDMELNADLNTQQSVKHTGNLEQIKGVWWFYQKFYIGAPLNFTLKTAMVFLPVIKNRYGVFTCGTQALFP